MRKKEVKIKELKINYQRAVEEICQFLRDYFRKAKRSQAVVGFSGGVDSAVVACLCEKAGLDLQKVFMPYGGISRRPPANFLEIDITKVVDFLIDAEADKIDKGNIMARVRMIHLYRLARRNGLVVGTENLSEYYLGYFTLHGDQACDLNPIGGFWKTQVMELAEYLGLPIEVPSAELYPGQTDEEEMGFSYQEADPILYLYCVKKLTPEKIIKDFGFGADLVNKVVERVERSKHKRQEVPKYEPGQ